MLPIKIRKTITAGETRSKESILSKIPPCPGIIFPESLILRLLFIIDSIKSPNVAKTDITAASAVYSINPNSVSMISKDFNIYATIKQTNNPPQKPYHDFLGEIRRKSLCLQNNMPIQNAPVSLSQMKRNNENTNIASVTEYR